MSSLHVICIVFLGVLAMTRGSNASCSNIHTDINSTQVATMCTDSVVTGSSVFIDTSHARNLSLTPGTICKCHAQLGEGTFNVSANFTDNTDSSSCGTYLQFHADVFSSNQSISCATNPLDSVFQNITNITVEYHIVSESIIGGYCVQLEQDFCADDEFRCTDGTCVPGDVRCNNFPDCPDESDEDCDFNTCNENQIICGEECITVDQICENSTVTNETSPAPEKSYITITCHELPASQVSTTTPAATALPTTSDVKTTRPQTDSTSTTPAATTSSTTSPSPLTTTPNTGSTLTVTDPSDTSNEDIGLILGLVFGILALAVLIIGVTVFCWRNYGRVKKYALRKIQMSILGHTGNVSQKVPSDQHGHDYVNTRKDDV